ncbi:peptidase inhibitor 16-like [Solea senegalensis]|uniref:Peptidase inhibitor 16 n=1 Tax=Solea senegalensis TaxID=28829 RepID=A0AAV6STU9_SOLSE|nr:peptidase inhibitor 16-like [Solea senegalensis]KAG7520048.1 peptidase inhibitor 16-like [Solea senegalensis]
MHQRSRSELQRVSTQRITQDGVFLRSSGPQSRGSSHCSLCPVGGAPLWVCRMLLVLLLLPGAWSFLNEEQEELLVELHNHYRGQVSPSASAMLPLKWDPSLKLLAEGYAAKCIWNHNRELTDTGENLFAGTGSLDLREALEKWFLEHLHYDFNNHSCDEDKMCGHYTQMVWAGTHRVGCAFHLCSTMEGLGWERVSFLVCNYYPPGNYEDERPYVEGDWCSRCPENLLKCENNLCVAEEEEEEEEEDEDDPDDTQWGTFPPPPVTSDQGDVVVPPPVTSGVTTTISVDDPEVTPEPQTPPPLVHSTTEGEKNKAEEKKEEEEEMKTKKKDEERKESVEKAVKEIGSDIVRKNPKKPQQTSAGSTTSPSLLLASLTVLLALKL